MSETATGTLAVSQIDASTFQYTITLTNTGSLPIETFWFAWQDVPDENFLPTSPTSVTPPANWTDIITNNGTADGFGIQFNATNNGTIDAQEQPGQQLTFTFDSTDTPAVVEGMSTIDAAFHVANAFVYSQGPVLGQSDTFVVTPCFCAGTRILTGTGETSVEDLAPGGLLPTRIRGHLAPVRWIGHRRVDCSRHPDPAKVWPVRVRAGAFAPDVPARDLWLSPDHAVHVDGVLVPVRTLINGGTIVQEPVAEVSYWHVELPRHEVLLAEGMPVESYLDTGNRAALLQSAPAVAALRA